jgi:hypothetical protein
MQAAERKKTGQLVSNKAVPGDKVAAVASVVADAAAVGNQWVWDAGTFLADGAPGLGADAAVAGHLQIGLNNGHPAG